MSVSCQKSYTIRISGCATPTVKNWTTAAPTGKTCDISAAGNFVDLGVVQPASDKLWLVPANTSGVWYADTFNLAAASPIPSVGAFAVDAAFPLAIAILYVPGVNKMVVMRQHWNGATYDDFVSFVDGTTGVLISDLTGLTTEIQNNAFCLVENATLTGKYVGWLTGNATMHFIVRVLDVTSGTVIATKDLGTANTRGICYSCVTDSFFVIRTPNTLVELDRATLAIKNTYVGVCTVGPNLPEYIKSTAEIWCSQSASVGPNNMEVDIVDPTNGTLKTTLVLADKFSGFSGGVGNFYTGFYHETLNAYCIPGPQSGFSGNPYMYYFYDVSTRLLKKSIDITAYYTLFSFFDWFTQVFDLTRGSVLLAGAPFNNTTNKGVLEIGTS